MTIEEKCIDTIRCLAIDAIEKANSGHPGAPMALAPAAYTLWMKYMHYNPLNPKWFNRDRFVLSNGHASMLQYALLYLTGYEVSLDDIKQFRQLSSITPGHPEHGLTPGIETTTGPLGQGLLNSVGMAMAEAHLAAVFNREHYKIVDHFTYVFCGDGDLMEGASQEAISIAGHLGLGKLIWLYDNNHITIEGNTNLTYSDDVAMRFAACHWHVQDIGDTANDIEVISGAYKAAKAVTDKPSLIILRSHIGYGSPNKHDTAAAHGSPLGAGEVALTKQFYGWPESPFYVPDEVKAHMYDAVKQGEGLESTWNDEFEDYHREYPDLARQFDLYLKQELSVGWNKDMPAYKPSDGPKATRSVTPDVFKALAQKMPWLIGGSADLGDSTQTIIESSGYISKERFANRNIAWGIREHVMCAASSGVALHGGVRPFASTYFVFTDYAKPALRLACIMELPIIYIMTHDSIGLGEDGKTHQPIEQLMSFRAMPGIVLIRPADANETVYAWQAAIQRKDGPTILVLSRQKLPIFDREIVSGAEGILKGAYILSPEKSGQPQAILMATGSEVQLIIEAQKQLLGNGIDVRVVSMPSWELFRMQPETYRDEVFPPSIKLRLSVEAGSPEGWHEWVGDDGAVISMNTFGASAPYKDLFEHFGFTIENVVNKVKSLVNNTKTK